MIKPEENPNSRANPLVSAILLSILGAVFLAQCEIMSSRDQAAAEAEAHEFMALMQVLGPLSRTNSYANVIPPQYTDIEDGTIKREHFLETCDRSGNCTYSNAYPASRAHRHARVHRKLSLDWSRSQS